MCKRLQNALNDWQTRLDNLSSMVQYCGYLRDYMDQSFDPEIVRACVGFGLVAKNRLCVFGFGRLDRQVSEDLW